MCFACCSVSAWHAGPPLPPHLDGAVGPQACVSRGTWGLPSDRGTKISKPHPKQPIRWFLWFHLSLKISTAPARRRGKEERLWVCCTDEEPRSGSSTTWTVVRFVRARGRTRRRRPSVSWRIARGVHTWFINFKILKIRHRKPRPGFQHLMNTWLYELAVWINCLIMIRMLFQSVLENCLPSRCEQFTRWGNWPRWIFKVHAVFLEKMERNLWTLCIWGKVGFVGNKEILFGF